VKQAEKEVERLEKLAEDLGEKEGPESPLVMDIYDVSQEPVQGYKSQLLTWHSVSMAWMPALSRLVPL
jgi:hypothetical protein